MKPSKASFLVMFLGSPGSGKGTQSLLLAEHFGFERIETSKLLEEMFSHSIAGETIKINKTIYRLDEQEQNWKTGLLVADAIVAEAVQLKLRELITQEKSMVLDGFPRTIEQMEYLLPFVDKMYEKNRFLVIYLDITEEDALFRNSHRRICKLSRHTILYTEETKHLTLCPLDGSKLLLRELDDPKIIRTRIQTFHKQTLPLLDYFENKKIKCVRVFARASVSEVFYIISKEMAKLIEK